MTLNEPDALNAFTEDLHEQFVDVWADVERDSECRAVVLTGGEYVFSAGMDIKEMNSLPDKESDEFLKSMIKYLRYGY